MLKPSVLVVDDDADLLEMVEFALRARGMAVHTLSGGGTVIETISTLKPDVIVMDIFLGDADGRQICKQIKSSVVNPSIPILLYSAGNIAVSSITESLADGFIQKPFDIPALVKHINEQVA